MNLPRRLTQLLSLVNIGLAVYAAQIYVGIWPRPQDQLLAATAVTGEGRPAREVSVSFTIPDDALPYEEYAAIFAGRSAFQPPAAATAQAQRDAEAAAQTAAQAAPVVPARLPYRIVGIFLGDDPVAVLEDEAGKISSAVRAGSPLGEGRVEHIGPAGVTVQWQGQVRRIEFER